MNYALMIYLKKYGVSGKETDYREKKLNFKTLFHPDEKEQM